MRWRTRSLRPVQSCKQQVDQLPIFLDDHGTIYRSVCCSIPSISRGVQASCAEGTVRQCKGNGRVCAPLGSMLLPRPAAKPLPRPGLSGLVDMVRLVKAGYGACKSAWVPSGRWEGCPCGAVPPAICCGVMRLTCMPRCDECMQTDGRCCTVCLTTSQPRRNKSE